MEFIKFKKPEPIEVSGMVIKKKEYFKKEFIYTLWAQTATGKDRYISFTDKTRNYEIGKVYLITGTLSQKVKEIDGIKLQNLRMYLTAESKELDGENGPN